MKQRAQFCRRCQECVHLEAPDDTPCPQCDGETEPVSEMEDYEPDHVIYAKENSR